MPAADNLPGQVIEGVESAKFNTVGSGPAYYTNQQFGNAGAHQQALNLIQANALNMFSTVMGAATGKIVKFLTELDAEEAASITPVTHSAGKSAGTQPPITVDGTKPA